MMKPHPLLSVRRLTTGLLAGLALVSLALAGNGYLPTHTTDRRTVTEPSFRSSYRLDDNEAGESFPRPWRTQNARPRTERVLPDRDDLERTPISRDQVPASLYDTEQWEPVPPGPRGYRTDKPSLDSVDVFDAPTLPTEQRRRIPADDKSGYPALRTPQGPQQSQPQSQPRTSAPKSHGTERPAIQDEITERYNDASLLRFMSSLRPEVGLALYEEVISYVIERHLQPPAPQAMSTRGLYNVQQALGNEAFLTATRLQLNAQQMASLQQALGQLAQKRVQSERDAVALLQQTMQQTAPLGLPSSLVVLEFIEGAVDGLDKYSRFLPPETAKAQNQQLGESLVGVGVTIEAADGGARIVKTIAGSPAAQAGLKQGDLLVSADGRKLTGMGLDGIIGLITGQEGSVAVLGVSRNGQSPVQLSVVRRHVQMHSVSDVQLLDPQTRIGYLKLDTFASTSTQEMQAALQSLTRQGMQGLIIDLRGNPGGLLNTAVELSDLFLVQGTIVSTRGRTEGDNSDTVAKHEQTWKTPLVVLIDENSASASEIMAAALQDNGRGVIVGRHSYGKGTVQTLFPLKTASASLRLTTARFYSPKGKAMSGQGVEPQVHSQNGTDSQGRDLDILAGVQTLRQMLNTPNQ